jgi:CyaY protein
MDDAQYISIAEGLYAHIESLIDDMIQEDIPLDYENSGGVLTIFCEDTDTQVIVSRQRAVHQIWVAAKSGGFHCDYVDQQWLCASTGEEFFKLLSRVCSEQSDKQITFFS